MSEQSTFNPIHPLLRCVVTEKRQRILVVDDSEVNREICGEVLSDDYEVRMAEDGESAIAVAASFEPDLILLDVMMPDMDGLAVCHALRRSSRPWVKVIMVSARVQAEDRIAAYAAGADDYVCKPFDENELLAKVRIHLQMRRIEEVDHVKEELLSMLQVGRRTPLEGVISHAKLLGSKKEFSEKDRRQSANFILRHAHRISDWLEAGEQLVAFKSGRVELAATRIHVLERAEAVVERLKAVEPFSEREISVRSSPELRASCDPDFFDLIVERLIRYTVGYSLVGPKVQIDIDDTQGDRVRLTTVRQLSDAPPANLLDLFEAFGFSDEVLHNRGDGISLALVKEAVTVHDGAVRARHLPGTGLEIQAEIPVQSKSSTPAPVAKKGGWRVV